MYQCLEPKSEVTILSKRSGPQGTGSSPHDSATSMSYWLKSNIQGDGSCSVENPNSCNHYVMCDRSEDGLAALAMVQPRTQRRTEQPLDHRVDCLHLPALTISSLVPIETPFHRKRPADRVFDPAPGRGIIGGASSFFAVPSLRARKRPAPPPFSEERGAEPAISPELWRRPGVTPANDRAATPRSDSPDAC